MKIPLRILGILLSANFALPSPCHALRVQQPRFNPATLSGMEESLKGPAQPLPAGGAEESQVREWQQRAENIVGETAVFIDRTIRAFPYGVAGLLPSAQIDIVQAEGTQYEVHADVSRQTDPDTGFYSNGYNCNDAAAWIAQRLEARFREAEIPEDQFSVRVKQGRMPIYSIDFYVEARVGSKKWVLSATPGLPTLGASLIEEGQPSTPAEWVSMNQDRGRRIKLHSPGEWAGWIPAAWIPLDEGHAAAISLGVVPSPKQKTVILAYQVDLIRKGNPSSQGDLVLGAVVHVDFDKLRVVRDRMASQPAWRPIALSVFKEPLGLDPIIVYSNGKRDVEPQSLRNHPYFEALSGILEDNQGLLYDLVARLRSWPAEWDASPAAGAEERKFKDPPEFQRHQEALIHDINEGPIENPFDIRLSPDGSLEAVENVPLIHRRIVSEDLHLSFQPIYDHLRDYRVLAFTKEGLWLANVRTGRFVLFEQKGSLVTQLRPPAKLWKGIGLAMRQLLGYIGQAGGVKQVEAPRPRGRKSSWAGTVHFELEQDRGIARVAVGKNGLVVSLLPPAAGAEEMFKELMDAARPWVEGVVGEKLLVLVQPEVAPQLGAAEMAAAARSLRSMNRYPMIEILPLSSNPEDREALILRYPGFKLVQIKRRPEQPQPSRSVVYVEFPAGAAGGIPKETFPLFITEVVSEWAGAQQADPFLQTLILLPAAPYLNAGGVLEGDFADRILSDRFA